MKMATNNKPEPCFPLLRLPFEIQHAICSLFCRHCKIPAPPPSAILSAPAGEAFQTLKALSETCCALNRIAQPILYHYPDVKAYTLFFKTAISRTDLAASVRVFARFYEAEWNSPWMRPRPGQREDFAYLIKLGQKYHLEDDGSGPDDAEEDLGAADDANFSRCFKYLVQTPDGDQEGYTRTMSHAAYCSLITALHFSILPRLEFAMIDMNDGRAWINHQLLTSGQLLFEYPYLKRAVSGNLNHFSYLRTVVFRRPYHYREESLGLESVAYLLDAIPNVRAVSFDLLQGTKPDEEYQDLDPFPTAPELSWSALPHLQEAYFDPCMRPDNPPPFIAISRMLQQCKQLKKLVYRHKFPDQHSPTLFSPAELFDAVSAAKNTLHHLEMYCNIAKIPRFQDGHLLDHRMKELSLLTTLVLDEELFCRHWLQDARADMNACLTTVLPENLTSLTVRLHDKFKAVPDIIQLGRVRALGCYTRLTNLQVHVLHDTTAPDDPYSSNRIPDSFDDSYLLHAVPPDKWEETLRGLTEKIRPDIVQAFPQMTLVEVRYVYEEIFSHRRLRFH